jgi:hypothetical protein
MVKASIRGRVPSQVWVEALAPESLPLGAPQPVNPSMVATMAVLCTNTLSCSLVS